MREVQDHYFQQAKREGYLSRAAYKLIEIDDRKKILHKGDRVLDCGAAPGSWLQVAAQRVGAKGVVVGIDLQPIRHGFDSHVRVLQGDFLTTTPAALFAAAAVVGGSASPGPSSLRSSDPASLRSSDPASLRSSDPASVHDEATPRPFDVVLSDMAPNTTGDPEGDHFRSVRLCEALLDRCPELLRAGGNLVMKVFEGQAYPDLLKRAAAMFETAKGYKPKASRSESAEMFIVAAGRRANLDSASATRQGEPVKRRPSAGWNKP